jgi:glycosyltransferase involved in cell wall biosynthesis
VNGRIVPAGDAEALADVLGSLLDDTPRLREMGRAGREIAEAEFEPEDHYAGMLEQYRMVAA